MLPLSLSTANSNGLSPLVLFLMTVCAVIVIGCLVWVVLLNKKNSHIETTIITVDAEEDELPDETTLEDIDEFFNEEENEDEF